MFVLLLGLAGAACAFGEELDLETFLAEVEANHPALRAARDRAEAAAHRVAPAGSWEDPFFAVGPDGFASEGGSAGLVRYQLSVSIPVPGRLEERADAEAERARAARADAETLERMVRVTAIQTFHRAVHNQRALELNGELRALVTEAVESGAARYQTGAPNHHEWLLARAELGVLEAESVRLESAQSALEAALNELRDRPAEEAVGRLLAPALADRLAEPAMEAAPRDSPELDSADALVRSAEARRRLARLGVVPDLLVQGMAEDPREGMESPMWGVMFGVSLPVFWFRKQDELTAAATRERDAAVAERRSLENRLRAEEVESQAAFEAARATLALYESSVVPLTDLALESARSGYAVGRVSLPDLIAVARVRAAQQLEQLAARIDVALARLRLEEILSAPPLLRLAPAAPSLFGAGMGGTATMAGPRAIRVGRGFGLGTGRGGEAPADRGGGMPGMGGM